MDPIILVINAGSSSIKFSLFAGGQKLQLRYHGLIEQVGQRAHFSVLDATETEIINQNLASSQYAGLWRCFFNWLRDLPEHNHLIAVGHRVVHGGKRFVGPVRITPEVMEEIAALIPLAPLHQNHNLNAIKVMAKDYPDLLQVACFDTAFHHTQNPLHRIFAIPRSLTDAGMVRFGFHGLSYEYMASILPEQLGELGSGRVIVAHLGNGASVCALYQGKSVATSMGLTALDGLMMGTRCGHIDPGLILYLMQEKHYSVEQMLHLLYHESGLLGVSGISSDMRLLLESEDPHAVEAVELFCYRAALEIGALSIALGGCDALVFTAGIGEHAPQVRQKICQYLQGLGVNLDDAANLQNARIISQKNSPVMACVIPTNEEYMIAKQTRKCY